MVERSPPEREVVSSNHSRVIGRQYIQLSNKLESHIDKPERWLVSGWMMCERLSCPNGEENALSSPTHLRPSLITVHNLRTEVAILDKDSLN